MLLQLLAGGSRTTRQKEEDVALAICLRGISLGEGGDIVSSKAHLPSLRDKFYQASILAPGAPAIGDVQEQADHCLQFTVMRDSDRLVARNKVGSSSSIWHVLILSSIWTHLLQGLYSPASSTILLDKLNRSNLPWTGKCRTVWPDPENLRASS